MWSTKSEMDFLKEIGQHSTKSTGKPRDRKKCLVGYLKGCEKRDNWNGINKEVVVSFAEQLLEHSDREGVS